MELRLIKEMGYDVLTLLQGLFTLLAIKKLRRKASPTPNLSTFELLLDCGPRARDILIATSPGSDS